MKRKGHGRKVLVSRLVDLCGLERETRSTCFACCAAVAEAPTLVCLPLYRGKGREVVSFVFCVRDHKEQSAFCLRAQTALSYVL